MSDLEFLDDIEENENGSKSHSNLLEAVSQLDKGQRVKKTERSEPTLEVSEFHLVKSGVSDSNVVQVKDLTKALGKKSHHLDIVKNLESARKKVNVLKKPLEKPTADRIKRTVGFENTRKELKKWNAVIVTNRTAESLHFPLGQPSMKLEPTKEFVKRFRIQSDLEKALAELEPQKENVEEKNDDFSLTMSEIITKRKEAAKIRAQQSYREAKSRRERKIKSKKFHRVQRKGKIKLQLKEFEELKKTNPEAALEKLEELDKARAQERMTLRHKNTGKWAQSKQIRAKYDKDTRQELAQQLSVGRDLTEKLKKVNDNEEEDEDEDDNSPMQPSATDTGNPWVQKTESEIDNFVKSYRKFWDKEKTKLPNESPKIIDNTESEKKEVEISVEKPSVANIFNESKKSPDNEKYKTLEDERTNTNTKSHERDKEHTKVAKSKDINKTNENKKVIKTVVLNNDKKSNKAVKLQRKGLKKAAATSKWNVEFVESVEGNHIQEEFSSSSNISNTEKINKIFNTLEDNIHDQIKSKFQHITKNYNQVPKKRKLKDCNTQEEDTFDGLEMHAVNKRLVIDSSLHESIDELDMDSNKELETTKNITYSNSLSINELNTNEVNKSEKEIDPSKYINIKPKHLHTDLPADITGGDDVLDDSEDEDERQNVISEAFADDDIVEEFRKEKEEKLKASQPKHIDLTLPGWGCWGGKNIKSSKRKSKRFISKFPKDLPRKNENKGDVIIFEDEKANIKQHQVSELPYPFTSVKDYEASVRMPIGREFVAESAHTKLIEPIVKTKMGKIIEPMTEDILVHVDKKKSQKFIAKRRSKIIKKKKNKI